MDFTYFLNILLRRKWLILSVTILSAAAAYYFVGKLPPSYKSNALISTGILVSKGKTLIEDNGYMQQFLYESKFNQLIEYMRSRQTIKKLSSQLLVHDLNADGVHKKPFRVLEDESSNFSKIELDDFARSLQINYDTINAEIDRFNTKLAKEFGYDYETLTEDLVVTRKGDTDLLEVQFVSEDPELSHFVVRTFLNEFFKLYDADLTREERISIEFHTEQSKKKKQQLDEKIDQINSYKSRNGVLDIDNQKEDVIANLRDYRAKRDEESQKIPALRATINTLGRKIYEYNKLYADNYGENVFNNEDLLKYDTEIKRLLNQYIDTGNELLQYKINALKEKRHENIERHGLQIKSGDNPIHDQVKDWVKEKLDKELELEFVQAASKSYEKEINNLLYRSNKFQENDAQLQTYMSEKDLLEKEYLKINADLEENLLQAARMENPLSVVEPPQRAEEPESSLRAIVTGFAGIAGGTLTSIFIFLLAFFDTSFQSPTQFKNLTRLNMLGFVNRIKSKQFNLEYLFHNTQKNKELEVFKESVRKLRYAVEDSGGSSFLFVSTKEQEGKSFIIGILSYALSLNNKKVLIIDTNFKNNTLSEIANQDQGLNGKNPIPKRLASGDYIIPPFPLDNVDIVGNKGGSQSPSEVLAGKDFRKILQGYAQKYDYILLEASSMNRYSDARELVQYVDKVIAIFSAYSSINTEDKDSLSFLRRLDDQFLGAILNNVELKKVS